jgi:transketolase
MDCTELQIKSVEYRRSILNIIKQANAGHTGGSLSCIDILNVLYNCILDVCPENFSDPNRDRYIHSKGHSVEALYVVLADKGFFPSSQLSTLEQYMSELIGHPTKKVPGIEQNTGALGHGLSVAVGMAIAAKLDHRPFRVYTMMGDGELTEGSIWEAAMSASHYQLDNLTAIIDRNGLQITGLTENVMRLEPLADRFRSFGFATHEVDGHDFEALLDVFNQLPFEQGKPNLIIAHTIKGKGVSFIENQVSWHHHVPNEVEFESALKELSLAEERLRNGAKSVSL